jgi:putative zinc finger/helix-turn-helix YgiT family protein
MTEVTHLKLQRQTCPECGQKEIRTRFETEEFPYGEGRGSVILKVEVPIRQCRSCGIEFTDTAADEIRDAAIRRHLGLLLPEQIRQIRKNCRASRKEFSSVTRIGEASLARWETGQLIQSGALDHFLFLLTFGENYERLRMRYQLPVTEITTIRQIHSDKPVLRVIDGGRRTELESSAHRFRLHVG